MIARIFCGEKANLTYLLRNETAEILDGNPQVFNAILSQFIDGPRFLSGSLTYSELTETPEGISVDLCGRRSIDRHILDVIFGRFKMLLSPAGDSTRTYWLRIRHHDKDKTQDHFLVPLMDLGTGKRFAPFLPRRDWLKLQLWQILENQSNGLSDPHEAARRMAARRNPRFKYVKQLNELDEQVRNAFCHGKITDRSSVVKILRSLGHEICEIGPRGGTSQLRVRFEDVWIPLYGVWYEKSFTAESLTNPRPRDWDADVAELISRHSAFCEETSSRYQIPPGTAEKPMINLPAIARFLEIYLAKPLRKIVALARPKHRESPPKSKKLAPKMKLTSPTNTAIDRAEQSSSDREDI